MLPARHSLVTSIPPLPVGDPNPRGERGLAALSKTLRTFDDSGFAVTSVNRPSEIEALRPLFPGVRFMTAESTNELFSERYGPSIGSLFAVCKGDKSCAIINADIHLLASDVRRVVENSPDVFFVAHRLDVDRIGGKIEGVYSNGIDAVFFSPNRFRALLADSLLGRFQLGAPFWDIVTPIMASFHGTVSFIEPPFILHTLHRARFSRDDYAELRKAAIETVIKHAEIHAATSARARGFLYLIDMQLNRRRAISHRRSIRRAMKVFDFWLAKMEKENTVKVSVNINGALSPLSLQMLANSDDLSQSRLNETNDENESAGSKLRQMRQTVRITLRIWRRERRHRKFANALADGNYL